MAIIVMLKIEHFVSRSALVQNRIPPNRPDQSFYGGMRKRHVRNSFDFGYLEYPKIGLPLVESIQRIMI